jgi:predicted dehydrogenase
MSFLNRRDFLKGSAGLGAALAGAGLVGSSSEAAQEQNQRGGANERLNVCVIGVNGQGKGHVGGYSGRHNCVVTHICDADSAVVRSAMDIAQKGQGFAPRYEQDLRRIMENRDIHVVSIATPNHWHALAAIWAMQAGKDVYVEKPVSHNVSEGRRIVEVARRTGKICQTGTQIRSNPGIKEAIDFLRSGKLGKVLVARGLCYKRRDSIGRAEGEQPIPKTVDYDLWCGPAPRRPLTRRRLHYDWHWTWDYGNGDLGNQGIHQMDVARWGLGKNELARSSLSVGGRFGYEDDGETANTQISVFDYGDSQLIFEVRGRPTKPFRGADVGNVFHCSDGYMVFPRYNVAIAYDLKGQELQRWTQGGNHFGNFIQAVRSRRHEDLNADILEGHLSSALCHLGNISYRLGQRVLFNGRTRAFGDNREAGETFARMQEHLRENGIAEDGATYVLGRRLTLDPKTERFSNDDEANRHLTREYRRGFEVPARA